MKTKKFLAVAVVAVVTVFGLCSFISQNTLRNEGTEDTHVHVQGTHCSGTVGCSCPGFSSITNGDVWQQAYCRHCTHKRSVHK